MFEDATTSHIHGNDDDGDNWWVPTLLPQWLCCRQWTSSRPGMRASRRGWLSESTFLGNQNYISAGVISNRGKEALPNDGRMTARAMTRQGCSKNNHVITDAPWEELVAHFAKFLWRSSCSSAPPPLLSVQPSENMRSDLFLKKIELDNRHRC